MSGGYYDYDEAQRIRRFERQEAQKINIALWPDQMVDNRSSGLLPDCEYCHRVLIASRKTPGKMMCPDCGNEYGGADEQTPKPVPKHMKPKKGTGAAPSLIIASQPNRRKKRGKGEKLSDDGDIDLRADLQAMGVIASDIQEY